MRFLCSIFLALFVCIGLFFGMHLMTSSSSNELNEHTQTRHLVYLMDKKETNLERKKRIKPPKPIKKEFLKKIKVAKTDTKPKTQENIKIKTFKPMMKMDLSDISSLKGIQVEMSNSYLDANLLNALRRVNPKYPRRAKIRKQAGFVNLAFEIGKNGLVSNVKILKSKPTGVFERSATKAIKKWKFKPNELSRNASITFNFRLAQ